MHTQATLPLYVGLLLLTGAAVAAGQIQEINSIDQYDKIRSQKKPIVIMYNSSTCGACKPMEEALEKVLTDQVCTKVQCYKLDLTKTDDKKKEIFEGLGKKIGIKAYPSTHFIEPGKEPRLERGAMGSVEIERVVYKMENGKEMPYKKPQQTQKAQS